MRLNRRSPATSGCPTKPSVLPPHLQHWNFFPLLSTGTTYNHVFQRDDPLENSSYGSQRSAKTVPAPASTIANQRTPLLTCTATHKHSQTKPGITLAVWPITFPQQCDTEADNILVLLEAPDRTDRPSPKTHRVLLTIDLTKAVADEAISLKSSVIVAYRLIPSRSAPSTLALLMR